MHAVSSNSHLTCYKQYCTKKTHKKPKIKPKKPEKNLHNFA